MKIEFSATIVNDGRSIEDVNEYKGDPLGHDFILNGLGVVTNRAKFYNRVYERRYPYPGTGAIQITNSDVSCIHCGKKDVIQVA